MPLRKIITIVLYLTFYLSIFFILLPAYADESDKNLLNRDQKNNSSGISMVEQMDSPVANSAGNSIGSNVVSQITKLFSGLLFIIALIFGIAWYWKKYAGLPFDNKQFIKVLHSVSVGQKEKLLIVQIESQKMLLGVTPGGIQKLSELEFDNTESENYFDSSTKARNNMLLFKLPALLKGGTRDKNE